MNELISSTLNKDISIRTNKKRNLRKNSIILANISHSVININNLKLNNQTKKLKERIERRNYTNNKNKLNNSLLI